MVTILFIGLVQSIFASILIFSQRKKEIHHYILGIWMIALTIQFLADLLSRYDEAYVLSNYNLIIFPFLQGPFIYLYTLFTIRGRQEFTKKLFLHLIPFVLFSLVFFALKSKSIFTPSTMLSRTENIPLIIYVYGTFIFIINIAYAVLTHKLIVLNRNKIKNVFSSESNEITLGWVRTIVYISIFFIIAFYLFAAADNSFFRTDFNYGYVLNIGLTLVVFIISYFGYRQQFIFSSDSTQEKKGEKEEFDKSHNKYQRSGLKPEEAQNHVDRIKEHMVDNKTYLNTELTIYSLSNELGIPQYHITQSLNETLQKNFYTFVNEFRVEEAKEKLADPKNDYLTVLGIGYESGFNSKSSFYSIFKKITGKSPSAYKKECQQIFNY